MITIFQIFAVLLILLFLGVPVAFSIGISSLAAIYFFGINVPLSMLPANMFSGLNSFTLMAVPFFVMAGEVMNKAGVTSRMIAFADAWVGHLRGGLSHVNVLCAMIMAGVSGSGTADAAALGTALIPAMEEKGYDRDYAVALTAAANTVGPIIPPSTLFILYGFYTGTSVSALFMGGLLPGIIIGLSVATLSYFICRKHGYGQDTRPFNIKNSLKQTVVNGPAVLVPAFLVIAITTGLCTATEAGVFIVFFSIILGICYGTLRSFSDFYDVIVRSVMSTASIFAMLATSGIFSNILARAKFQTIIVEVLHGLIDTPRLLLLAVFAFILVLGCFVDVAPMIIMFSAAFCAVAVQAGISPLTFGVIFVISGMLGSITPPVGCLLFITTQVSGLPMTRTVKRIWPFMILYTASVMLLIVFPGICTFVPSLIG
ncbi:TRAP transporter large permease [uncultured Oscillibacter sp.]|uniref:TRAP transporter large permease n=1 Tax=uncultured Oscillibacter sp. TaxID=876091 RepID=UPI002804F9BE|nr:TRAP transporter large permease [uncultured Oscillibacter sp.]